MGVNEELVSAWEDGVDAEGGAASDSSLPNGSYFGFSAGGFNYLLNADHVVEMTARAKLSPMPLAKAWNAGAANVRGSVYCVTDLSLFAGGPATGRGKFLILSSGLIAGAALLIDGFVGLFTEDVVLDSAIEMALPDHRPWICGRHEIGGAMFLRISGERLAVDVEFARLQTGELNEY